MWQAATGNWVRQTCAYLSLEMSWQSCQQHAPHPTHSFGVLYKRLSANLISELFRCQPKQMASTQPRSPHTPAIGAYKMLVTNLVAYSTSSHEDVEGGGIFGVGWALFGAYFKAPPLEETCQTHILHKCCT